MAAAGASQQAHTSPPAAPVPTDTTWNASCRHVPAAGPGPAGPGLRPAAPEPAGMSSPATARKRDSCRAVSPCTAQMASTGPAMTTAAYSTMWPQLPTGQFTRLKTAAPQITASPPSKAAPTDATNRAASPFLVARQAGADRSDLTTAPTHRTVTSAEDMTSTYKDIQLVTIGLSCRPR